MMNLIDNLIDILRSQPTPTIEYSYSLILNGFEKIPQADKDIKTIMKIGMKIDITYPCGRMGTKYEKFRKDDDLNIGVTLDEEGKFLYTIENDGFRMDPKHKLKLNCVYTSEELQSLEVSLLF